MLILLVYSVISRYRGHYSDSEMGRVAGEFNSIPNGRGRDFYLCDPVHTSGGFLSYEYVTRGLFQEVKKPGLQTSHSPSSSAED